MATSKEIVMSSFITPVNAEVSQGKVLVIKKEGNTFLEVIDNQNRRVVTFREDPSLASLPLVQMDLGAKDISGFVRVKDEECRDAICLDGANATVIAGCEFVDGEILIRDARNNDTIFINGATGMIAIGGNRSAGQLSIFTPGQDLSGTPPQQAALHMDGNSGVLNLNGNGIDGGRIILRRQGQEVIIIDGDRGEIEFFNADFAEDFDLTPTLPATAVEPGMVMVFDENGDLRPCEKAYDPKVAGVVSGAGDYAPGIVMDKRNTGKLRKPIALVGKVYCLVDATEQAVEVGDLLTPSTTTGHAMKAVDPLKTFGASIGKALKAMPQGTRGLLPIVVSLQ